MAVTAAQTPRTKSGDCSDHPVLASAVMYGGTLGFLEGGYANSDTDTGNNKFAGIVRDTVDNSSGGNGAKSCEFKRKGLFLLTGSGFAIGDVGVAVYASDNFTITKTSTNNVQIGKIAKFVSATEVWVDIDGYAE